MSTKLNAGDKVVYEKHKRSEHPSRWARDVHPEPHGEGYSYIVDKYWTVVDVDEQKGTVTCATRGGKRNVVRVDDPHLRGASWIEHLVHKYRLCDEYDPRKKTFPDPLRLMVEQIAEARDAGESED